MKKIIFAICFLLSTNLYSQCPIANGNFKTVAICSLTVSTGPFNITPPATFANSVTAPNFIGGWNGYSNILTAASSIGLDPSNLVAKSDSNILFPTYYIFKDSLTVHRAYINTMLSKTSAASLYYPLSGNPSGFLTSVPAQSFSSLTGKPTTLSGYGITDAYPLSGNPSNFLTSVPAQSFASLTGKPTTLSGYGITDAYPLSGNPSNFLTSEVDGNTTNEIQTISRTNGTVSLSLSGGNIHLPDSSATNEIELPSQSGQSGKVLTTNGTSPAWSTPTNATVTLSGDVSGSGTTAITTTLATTGVSAGNYDWVTVDTKGRVTAGGAASVPTAIAAGARNFNTAYQVSTTLNSIISVSPQISCNLSLTGGQSGTIVLEISANGTTGWIYAGQVSGSNTGTLTIGLNTTQISGAQLTQRLQPGYYWRLTTTNIAGTPTYTFNGGNYITY